MNYCIRDSEIFELTANNMINYLDSQEKVISAVSSRGSYQQKNYIVASVDATGKFSTSANPAINDAHQARKEAERLSKQNPNKMFVLLALEGLELVRMSQPITISK